MATTIRAFKGSKAFPALDVCDLLTAREAYHVHLTRMPRVVGTAIGRYRKYRDRPRPQETAEPNTWKHEDEAPPKSLANSCVADDSWPCILVLVDRWLTRKQMRKQPDDVVPARLFMPDGTLVPTCVLEVHPDTGPDAPLGELAFPLGMMGGGFPVVTDLQGEPHVGSVGCLVTDGDELYALTSHHVTGQTGREIRARVHGTTVRIGVTASKHVGKLAFGKVFPGWPGAQAYANLDVGLIRIDDVADWTAQVYGIGQLGPLVDMYPPTITLDLIGTQLRAFGGASGELSGEVQGLFYRYRSIAGFDYVADLLIGPPDAGHPVRTRPGDSGTVWVARHEDDGPNAVQHPIAIQWGGHRFLDANGSGQFQFALATFLSSVCRELDVALVPDLNVGHSEYWGKLGHFKIGAKACELVSTTALATLLMANQNRIGPTDDVLNNVLRPIQRQELVPLADVADLVWRSSRGKDKANHFADMDQKGKGAFAGKTLLDLCKKDANVDASVFAKFYDSIGETVDKNRGALPFRVWQMYDEMVAFLEKGDVAGFLAAGGTMSHYVGDACQPLHVSHLHHGSNDAEFPVHEAYETRMLDRNRLDVVADVNAELAGWKAKPSVKGGAAAAVATVGIMRNTIQTLPPQEVIDVFKATKADTKKMWEKLGPKTVKCIARGCKTLAQLWESAWKEGKGSKIPKTKLKAIRPSILKGLYERKDFVESMWLDEMVKAGVGIRK
jgi:hypothetical protein